MERIILKWARGYWVHLFWSYTQMCLVFCVCGLDSMLFLYAPVRIPDCFTLTSGFNRSRGRRRSEPRGRPWGFLVCWYYQQLVNGSQQLCGVAITWEATSRYFMNILTLFLKSLHSGGEELQLWNHGKNSPCWVCSGLQWCFTQSLWAWPALRAAHLPPVLQLPLWLEVLLLLFPPQATSASYGGLSLHHKCFWKSWG